MKLVFSTNCDSMIGGSANVTHCDIFILILADPNLFCIPDRRFLNIKPTF